LASRPRSQRSRKPDRAALVADLARALRRAGQHAVFFHHAAAEQLGLSAPDSRVLSYLQEAGPVPAGQLAAVTGLTTGAVTGMIDRLERAGAVRREADPQDRRKVLVVPLAGTPSRARTERVFAPLGKAFAGLAARYSEAELATVLEFVDRASEMMREQTARLTHKKES
jgi:DNA-binding MarR family transcriptional regulator